jgi:hypothetical protein
MKLVARLNRFLHWTLIAMALCESFSVHATDQWPEVRSVQEKRIFDDVDKAALDLKIVGRDGRPLYRLECHSGLYEGDAKFNYSGVFDCRLTSLYSLEAVSTLLTDDPHQPNDWSDRGRFLAEHLRRGCIEYPDWGGTRVFRLRGMRLSIEISNVGYDDSVASASAVRSFSVSVDVKPAKNALTSLSGKPESPEPRWFYHPAENCIK